jgi:hypothetical protein
MIHSFPDNSSCRLPEAHNAQSADIHAPARKKISAVALFGSSFGAKTAPK